jgi:general secretion pathway protein H
LGVRRQRGFTLIELMVVLAILGLAYALVPPLFSGALATAELKGATRQLAAGLRQVRNYAVVKRTEAVLTLDVENREFTMSGDSRTYRLPRQVQLKLQTAQREAINDKIASIRFYADGSSDGGRVTLDSGERSFEVDVNWLTGRVAILD